MLNAEMLDRQIEMEHVAKDRGVARFKSGWDSARSAERGDETQAGMTLLKESLDPVSRAIAAKIAEAQSGRAGRRATAIHLIGDIDPTLLAYFTLTSILASVAVYRTRTMSGLVQSIASGLETELRLSAFEDEKPALYDTIRRNMAERGSGIGHVEKVLKATMSKYGVEWEGWSAGQRIHIGMFLFDAALQAFPWVTVKNVVVGKNRTAPVVEATPELIAWLTDRNEKLSILRPVMLPMIVPPRPWRGVRGGGYRSDAILKTALVKRASKDHLVALQGADLGPVLTGLNAIQDTRWRINRAVLEVAQEAWANNIQIGRDDDPTLPSRDRLTKKIDKIEDILPKPVDIETNEDARAEWKRSAKEIYTAHAKGRAHGVLADQILKTAGDMVEEEAIFFPHNLDFRGRCYARPGGLQPQGNDLCRGLLTFAEGKPLGSERAVGWLAIHGANCFGVDKVSHADRIDWVYEHETDILLVAADPLTHRWWTEADSPWSFLAFCYEWQGFLWQGLDFKSALPIALDGSCNGLQHFSAMLRDPVGGAAVNLIAHDVPQDIYGRVAEAVVRKLGEIAADPEHPDAWVAQSWKDFGIDRKITKRPVMVLPYGGTQSSCRSYVIEAVRKKVRAGQENPFGEELTKQAGWLGGIVWAAIGETVVAARDAMKFLRDVAKVASKHEVALTWTTPSGFVARQAYHDTKNRQVETKLHGTVIYKLMVKEPINKLDKMRQQSGISPNFVHSLDAAAMMLTIETALANGVQSFAMIHDSYGTHAADTDTLSACLREVFVDMYEERDVLAQFRDGIAERLPPEAVASLPALPECGSLDLKGVLESAFFFS